MNVQSMTVQYADIWIRPLILHLILMLKFTFCGKKHSSPTRFVQTNTSHPQNMFKKITAHWYVPCKKNNWPIRSVQKDRTGTWRLAGPNVEQVLLWTERGKKHEQRKTIVTQDENLDNLTIILISILLSTVIFKIFIKTPQSWQSHVKRLLKTIQMMMLIMRSCNL